MAMLDTREKYGFVSRSIHWVVVLAILAQWLLAEADEDSMPVVGSGLSAMTWHQSIGLIVLALAVARVGWRLLSPTPAWPPDMKRYEKVIARVVHVAFYALLFLIPLTGWALSSVEDEPLRFFGAFDVPRIVLGSEDALEDLHETLFNVLAALAALHALGAAKHWIAARGRRDIRATPREARP